jgi:hypothetical protein
VGAFDHQAEEVAAGVVGMPMREERARQLVAAATDGLYQLVDRPGRVDEPGSARLGIPE